MRKNTEASTNYPKYEILFTKAKGLYIIIVYWGVTVYIAYQKKRYGRILLPPPVRRDIKARETYYKNSLCVEHGLFCS